MAIFIPAPRRVLRLAAVAPLLSIAAIHGAWAADPVLDNQWHGNVAVGGSFASGNTSLTTISASAEATKASAADKISLGALLNYGRTDTATTGRTTTADQAWLRGRYDYNLSQTVFVFSGGDLGTNKVGGIDSR